MCKLLFNKNYYDRLNRLQRNYLRSCLIKLFKKVYNCVNLSSLFTLNFYQESIKSVLFLDCLGFKPQLNLIKNTSSHG